MCGITGVIDFNDNINISQKLLLDMSTFLKYRGPDKDGFYIKKNHSSSIGLAHKRLSIIDILDGNQPFKSSSGKSIIVFNGEIYNYKALRKELLDKGCSFTSYSDTEVILNSYEIFGIKKTLQILEGMFAFAIYDIKTNQIILARDRFGEKPLYYYKNGKSLAFSSDIRSFKCLNWKLTIDSYALEYFFQELSTPKINSIWKQVKKLEPGKYAIFDSLGFHDEFYWNLDYRNKIELSEKEIINEVENRIKKSVQKCLVADVPVGAFLSGGIDSSLITLYAAEFSKRKIDTFSVGFEYDDFNELPYARNVSKIIDSNHHEIILNASHLEIANELIDEYGEPFADSSMIPTYYVSKFASSSIKVALGGDGGDEVFAGYKTYNQALRMQKWFNNAWTEYFINLFSKFILKEKMNYLIGVINKKESTISSALYRNMGFNNNELNLLLMKSFDSKTAMEEEYNKVIKNAFKRSNNIFDSILFGSIHTRMVNDYLVKTDRASMYNSLELRTPFVDKELVEFCSSIPYSKLMKNGKNKYITKKISEKYFESDFIYRKKMGFGIPIGKWIKKEWKKEFKNVILCEQNIYPINYSFVKHIFEEHCSGKKNHEDKLWAIYVFQRWIITNH